MKRTPFYKSVHFILLITAIVTNMLLAMVFMYINANIVIPIGINWFDFLREDWFLFVQFYTFSYFVYYTIQFFNRRYSIAPNSASRFVKEIFFIIIGGFVIQEFFRLLFIHFIVVPEDPKTLNMKLRMLQMVNLATILVLYSFMTSLRIFRFLQQKQLELIQWQKEYTQTQFENLKNQLNPHFLFNSLSILTSLVYVDADRAEMFIEKLSKTYRYLLEQKDKDTVPLKAELDFLQNYYFLIGQRFGKKLQLEISADTLQTQAALPPYSIMTAMEYIIANNAMSAASPMYIRVAVENNSLCVQHTRRPKAQIENTSWQQLESLKEKYHFLPTQNKFEIKEGDEWQTICFPLQLKHERPQPAI